MTTSYRIVVTREARDELDELHSYITAAADAETASRFTDGIIDHIATLSAFPKIGRHAMISVLDFARYHGDGE